jgi:hypothetical protein
MIVRSFENFSLWLVFSDLLQNDREKFLEFQPLAGILTSPSKLSWEVWRISALGWYSQTFYEMIVRSFENSSPGLVFSDLLRHGREKFWEFQPLAGILRHSSKRSWEVWRISALIRSIQSISVSPLLFSKDKWAQEMIVTPNLYPEANTIKLFKLVIQWGSISPKMAAHIPGIGWCVLFTFIIFLQRAKHTNWDTLCHLTSCL